MLCRSHQYAEHNAIIYTKHRIQTQPVHGRTQAFKLMFYMLIYMITMATFTSAAWT